MKKIVFFTGSMGRGGAERVISILSDVYAKKGWKVDIVMLLHNKSGGYTLNENVSVKTFFPKNSGLVKKMLLNIINVRAYLKKEKPDVIVAFMAHYILISAIASKGLGIRYIASERIDPTSVKHNFIYRAVLNKIYEKADKIIFQTERAKNYFNEKIQKNGRIIGNPISIKCKAEENTRKKIVSVGRLTQQKNHKMLINAFYRVVKQYPEYILEIYGDGLEKSNLLKQIKNLGMEEHVFLCGNHPDIHEKIKDAQIFVLSSDFEGLSNALLEAMMMGISCISTDCAGSDEVIENKVNGLLVGVGKEDQLTNAIIELIENDELRQNIAQKARESVERFKTENIIDQWSEVIEG